MKAAPKTSREEMVDSREKVAKRATWYKKPTDDQLLQMRFESMNRTIGRLPPPPGTSSRETILALERQLNGGRQLSK